MMHLPAIALASALARLEPGQTAHTPEGVRAHRVTVATASSPWQRRVMDATSHGADGVKVGDLNRDGWPDFVTGWEEGGEVRVYLHPGPSGVREPWPRVTVGKVQDAEDAFFADLDRDGQLDVITCTEGNTRTVYWHRASGDATELLDSARWSTVAFPATVRQQAWMQGMTLDLDGQHGPDLVLASKNRSATVGWLQAPSDPLDLAGWQFHSLRTAGWIMSLMATDFDHDGDPDLLITDRKGARAGVFWLENPGSNANRKHAAWREHGLGALGREVMFADLADVNGDGQADVSVAVKPRDILCCLRSAAAAWEYQVIELGAAQLGDAKAVSVADVNNDGRADLIYTCENARGDREGIVWLEQEATGTWRQHSLGGPAGVKFDLMQVLDLDADGDLDVVTCEESDQLGVVWYENPSR